MLTKPNHRLVPLLPYFLAPFLVTSLGWSLLSSLSCLALSIAACVIHLQRNYTSRMPLYLFRLLGLLTIQFMIAMAVNGNNHANGGSDNADQFVPEVDLQVVLPGAVKLDILADKSVITLSVVLPCANEQRFAWMTAKSIAESTPSYVLKEVIVVDDGSTPPLQEKFPKDIVESAKVKFVRHEHHTGLINAKAAGAEIATGDIIVFLDCHVKPAAEWWNPIIEKIRTNYRRIVVPSITDLNVDTWTENRRSGGLSKCYLTWDSDFKWFESDDEFVAVMSGGLLAMSNEWWKETGGYDRNMLGWGGENIDQSVRTWLCGGEIVNAKHSYIAHMWRTADKPDTAAKYSVPAGSVTVNRYRAASAWMSEWTDKIETFPEFKKFKDKSLRPDISNILEVKNRLKCHHFSYYIDKFYKIYHWGGLLPKNVFQFRDAKSGLCLEHEHGDKVVIAPCGDSTVQGQLWHHANRDGNKCCSGFRNWNTDQCMASYGVGNQVTTFTCDISGSNRAEFVSLNEKTNQLEFVDHPGSCVGGVMEVGPQATVESCNGEIRQKFRKIPVKTDGNTNVFQFELSYKPGKCLAALNSHIEVHNCNDASSIQLFEVKTVLGGKETRLAGAGQKMCVDIGNGLILYHCYDNVNDNQNLMLSSVNKDVVTIGFGPRNKCVSVPVGIEDAKVESTTVLLSNCLTDSNKNVRKSQDFAKVSIQGDTFALQTLDGRCLSVDNSDNNRHVILTKHCDTEKWSYKAGDPEKRLKHIPTGLCLDLNHELTVYTCYSGANLNQQVDLSRDHMVVMEHGNMCLDFSPAKPSPANTIPCTVAESTFKWEKHQVFIPVETELYNKWKASSHK